MNDKPPLQEMLELVRAEMDRIARRQEPRMSVEALADLIWWSLRLRRMKLSGTAARH